MIKIAPSILSADFMHLGREVEDCFESGADYIHFDVMDGIFVPNISIGIPVLKSLRSYTKRILDVHLMIDRPIRYVESFCKAGADIVTVHVESDTRSNIKDTLNLIHACGKKTGLAIKPKTAPESIKDFVALVDMVLVMTVEPGFGGQKFMMDALDNIRGVHNIIYQNGSSSDIEVDGGIDLSTAKLALDAGANVLVSGSAFFKSEDKKDFVSHLKSL